MQMKDVDPVEPQPRKTAFERCLYRLINAAEVAGRQPDLGADDHVRRFQFLQHTAKVLSRLAIAVQYRRVEVIDAGGDRPRDGPFLIGSIAAHHQTAHGAAAEAEYREPHSRAPKSPKFHRRSSDRS